MIRPLRRVHAASFCVLAVALPVGLAAAIAARPDIPVQPSLPAVGPAANSSPRAPSEGRLQVGEVSVRWRSFDDDRLATRVIELTPSADLLLADALVVYSSSGSTDVPPQGAMTLGSLRGAQTVRMELPRGALGGRLHLYCAAEDRWIASAEFDR